ncbi:MAG: SCO family protein [Flavobacteriaceae bacterium]|nr:SCO family protein [Flavobacteriaceae bacterium]
MLSYVKQYKVFFYILGALSAVILTIFYFILKEDRILPVYHPADFNPVLLDSSIAHVKKHHKIADFSLTNQNGRTITQDDYKDKIYVADFFFTTCATICPIMTDNMKIVQQKIRFDKDIMLLSHSVTPERDSVAQLKNYALEKGVDSKKWNLVTGDKREIYKLARKSYCVAKTLGDGGPFDMIHTENFVLVDKEKRIRGTYDGTDKEEIEKLLEDIEVLKKEYEK